MFNNKNQPFIMLEKCYDDRIEQTYNDGQRYVWYQNKDKPEKLDSLTKEELEKFKKIIDNEFLDVSDQSIIIE